MNGYPPTKIVITPFPLVEGGLPDPIALFPPQAGLRYEFVEGYGRVLTANLGSQDEENAVLAAVDAVNESPGSGYFMGVSFLIDPDWSKAVGELRDYLIFAPSVPGPAPECPVCAPCEPCLGQPPTIEPPVAEVPIELPEIEIPSEPIPAPVRCTMDVRQCPDGSYVARTGPNCEFRPCPPWNPPPVVPLPLQPTPPQDYYGGSHTLLGVWP